MQPLRAIGRKSLAFWDALSDISSLPIAAAKGALLERPRARGLVAKSIIEQIYFTAVEPLGVFLVVGATLGAIVLIGADALLRPLGFLRWWPAVVGHALALELTPLVLALILVGRSGTAIASELGGMRVNRETDGLASCGINLDYFLVLPRIVGVTIASAALAVSMVASGLVAGFVLGRASGTLGAGVRPSDLLAALDLPTMAQTIGRAGFFGAAIATINCHHGLRVGRSASEIPKANVRGAVQSYLVCVGANAVLTVVSLLQVARSIRP